MAVLPSHLFLASLLLPLLVQYPLKSVQRQYNDPNFFLFCLETIMAPDATQQESDREKDREHEREKDIDRGEKGAGSKQKQSVSSKSLNFCL